MLSVILFLIPYFAVPFFLSGLNIPEIFLSLLILVMSLLCYLVRYPTSVAIESSHSIYNTFLHFCFIGSCVYHRDNYPASAATVPIFRLYNSVNNILYRPLPPFHLQCIHVCTSIIFIHMSIIMINYPASAATVPIFRL
jgi:hypothetical protein